MDVREIRVWFFTLKSAKGVFLAKKICKGFHFQVIEVSNFCKIIKFFDQITEVLRNFFNDAKIYSWKFIFRRFRVYIFEIFPPFGCKDPKFCRNFALQRVRIWKSLTHIHILDFIGVPLPPRKTTKTECRNLCCSQKDLSVVYEHL